MIFPEPHDIAGCKRYIAVCEWRVRAEEHRRDKRRDNEVCMNEVIADTVGMAPVVEDRIFARQTVAALTRLYGPRATAWFLREMQTESASTPVRGKLYRMRKRLRKALGVT